MPFTREEILLEPATREQADAVAPLLYDTDPHLFSHFFSGDQELALRYFAAQWRQERSLFSYRYCTVAAARGALLGIELGYDGKTQADVARDTGRYAAQILTPEQMVHLREAVSYVRLLVPPVPNHAYYVLHLASACNARGRGVGASCSGPRSTGRGTMAIMSASSTSRATIPAVRFYERMGMDIRSEAASYLCKSTASPATIGWSRSSSAPYLPKVHWRAPHEHASFFALRARCAIGVLLPIHPRALTLTSDGSSPEVRLLHFRFAHSVVNL
jgi:hypothetical protein